MVLWFRLCPFIDEGPGSRSRWVTRPKKNNTHTHTHTHTYTYMLSCCLSLFQPQKRPKPLQGGHDSHPHPAPNHPIPFVHFLENINYPLRCTKSLFLPRLWVPADRVLSPWSPVVVSRARAPPEVPNAAYAAAGGAESFAGAPQGLSRSRRASVTSPGSSLLAGRGRGGRRPCACHPRALCALPSAGATRPSGRQPPPRGRERCGRSPPRPQVGEEGRGPGGTGDPRRPAGVGGLAPRNPRHGSMGQGQLPSLGTSDVLAMHVQAARPKAAAPLPGPSPHPPTLPQQREPSPGGSVSLPIPLSSSSERGALSAPARVPPARRSHCPLLQGTESPLFPKASGTPSPFPRAQLTSFSGSHPSDGFHPIQNESAMISSSFPRPSRGVRGSWVLAQDWIQVSSVVAAGTTQGLAGPRPSSWQLYSHPLLVAEQGFGGGAPPVTWAGCGVGSRLWGKIGGSPRLQSLPRLLCPPLN